MKAAELYQTMAATVCRHTGVGEVDMLESNKEECVTQDIYLFIFFPNALQMRKFPVKQTFPDSQSTEYGIVLHTR